MVEVLWSQSKVADGELTVARWSWLVMVGVLARCAAKQFNWRNEYQKNRSIASSNSQTIRAFSIVMYYGRFASLRKSYADSIKWGMGGCSNFEEAGTLRGG